MKSYTDLEQSKKFAEILPIESADMNWHELPSTGYFVRAFPYKHDNGATEGIFPCWSLGVLFSFLPFHLIVNNKRYAFGMFKGLNKEGETYVLRYNVYNTEITLCETDYYNNPVDACYELILKLHELNLL